MSALPVFLRPSTKIREIDLTQRIQVILSTTAAVVGEFKRGPVIPTYQSGLVEDFMKLYGAIADPTISFAHDTCTSFMTQSSNLLVHRVTKDAKYAKSSVLRDIAEKRLLLIPGSGTDGNYEDEGLNAHVMLKLDAALIALNVISIDITDGVTVETATATFATDSATTLNTFVTNIQSKLNGFGAGSLVTLYDSETIIINVSKTVSLEFLDFEVTLGASQATATLVEDSHLFDVFSENPGDWANDYGYTISNVDTGVRERYRLTLSAAVVTSNSISITVNGSVITQVFTSTSDATLTALAAKIALHADVASATVESVVGGTSNDRSILIIAKIPKPTALVFTAMAVTLGASQAAISVSTVMTGVVADSSFTFTLYNRSNLNVHEERFTVSLKKQLSSLGYQQNIEHVINRASTKSINIRIKQTAWSLTSSIYSSDGLPLAVPSTVSFLTGGDDGVSATSAEVRQGWLTLEDRNNYPVDILLNAGYTSISVQKEMAALAERRFDCMAILDAPSDRQGAQELRAYRMDELDIDTTYAAMYTPDVEIEDINTGERRYIPPSGLIGATYAYSDRLTNHVGAPAGLNRGKINMAVGLRHKYTPAQEELLFPVGLNCIIDKAKIGPVVMGEETLQSKKTVLSSVHARRILNRIKIGLVDGLDYTLFEPNTQWTRLNAVQLGETLLKPMKRGGGEGGLYDYRIKCDDDNNTPDVIDAEQLAYDVYLKITQVIKGIAVRAILTRTGASFQEYIDNGF